MAFFSSSHNIAIHGGEFHADNRTFNLTGPDRVLAFVGQHTAENAFYNSEQRFPPPNCHPGTREEVLRQLNQWIQDETGATRAYWLHGPAGVGKSAIAQAISEQHADDSAASFFFSRNDTSRDRLDPFVATIVYQLLKSERFPGIDSVITDTIKSDPKIFSLSFEDQFQKLIIKPFRSWRWGAPLVVIDGLDECVSVESQARLLAMVRKAIVARCPLKFLIASRPEPQIHREFDHDGFRFLLGRLAIGDSSHSTRDITKFLHDRFAALRRKHHALRYTSASWPSEGDIQQLVMRACGQFIFAATVMKYLESDDDVPTERLRVILRVRTEDLPESPYPELDLLYRQILDTCPNYGKARQILRLLVSTDTIDTSLTPYLSWKSVLGITTLLELQPGEVESRLYRLHAVMDVPGGGQDVRILHASFTEFLLAPGRSGKYCAESLSVAEFHERAAITLLNALLPWSQRYPFSTSEFRPALLSWEDVRSLSSEDPVLHSASSSCLAYCLKLVDPSRELLTALDQFDPYCTSSLFLRMTNFRVMQEHRLPGWIGATSWAKVGIRYSGLRHALIPHHHKSLGKRAPRTFIKTMEMFMRGFRVGSSSATAARLAKPRLEFALHDDHSSQWAGVSWVMGADTLSTRSAGAAFTEFVYVFPATSQINPPSTWVIVLVRGKKKSLPRPFAYLFSCIP